MIQSLHKFQDEWKKNKKEVQMQASLHNYQFIELPDFDEIEKNYEGIMNQLLKKKIYSVILNINGTFIRYDLYLQYLLALVERIFSSEIWNHVIINFTNCHPSYKKMWISLKDS